jgi:CheY-like chemotaxis protein
MAHHVLSLKAKTFQYGGSGPAERRIMEPSESASNAADFADIRILIIDDDGVIAMLAKCILERLGCIVQVSSNSVKALEKYSQEKHTIDLLLVDYFMPTLDGGAMIDHLRKLNPEVKVLLFSGADEMRLRQIVRRYSIAGYLHKPLRTEEVRQAFREIFPVRPEPAANA